MQKTLSRMTRVQRIKYWKDKYKDMPNGFWVAMLIGSDYDESMSSLSRQQRDRYRKKRETWKQ